MDDQAHGSCGARDPSTRKQRGSAPRVGKRAGDHRSDVVGGSPACAIGAAPVDNSCGARWTSLWDPCYDDDNTLEKKEAVDYFLYFSGTIADHVPVFGTIDLKILDTRHGRRVQVALPAGQVCPRRAGNPLPALHLQTPLCHPHCGAHARNGSAS